MRIKLTVTQSCTIQVSYQRSAVGENLSASRCRQRVVPAQAEITAMQPGCLAGRAHLGCHIYGIQWLAFSQITHNGKATHHSPCTQNFDLDKWVLEKLPTADELISWLVFQVRMHWCSLCHSAPFCVFREQIGTGEVLGLVITGLFSFGACTKLLWAWLRSDVHLS